MTHVLLRVTRLYTDSHGPKVTVRAEQPDTSRAVTFDVAPNRAGDPAPSFTYLMYYRALDGSQQCCAQRTGSSDVVSVADGGDLKWFASDRFGWLVSHGARVADYPWYGPKLRRLAREHADSFYEDAGRGEAGRVHAGLRPLSLAEAREVLTRKRRDEARAVTLEVTKRLYDPTWTVPRYHGDGEPWPVDERLQLLRDQLRAEDKAQESWDKAHTRYVELCKLCGVPFWWNLKEYRDAPDDKHPELFLVDEVEV